MPLIKTHLSIKSLASFSAKKSAKSLSNSKSITKDDATIIQLHKAQGDLSIADDKKESQSALASLVPSEMAKRSRSKKMDPSPRRSRKDGKSSSRTKKKFKKFLTDYDKLASKVLTAYLGFWNVEKRKMEYLIPKDKAAWLEFLLTVTKKHTNIEYLTDRELKKVIIRARPNLIRYKKTQGPVVDPDMPPCLDWTAEQVGNWIESNTRWPQLKDAFVTNIITGRRLIMIDCATLNKMGMTDLAGMREVAGKIRDLLGIPPPNGMRAIMRVSPYELFLRRKMFNGRGYDELTFQKFCENEGYNYEVIKQNRNAQIPCTAEVMITAPGHQTVEGEEDEDRESDDHSLLNAPTVENLARNALIRNKKIQEIMEAILQSVFLPPRERKYGKEMWGSLKRGIGEGYDDLHLHYPKDKLEFASGVVHGLLDELFKTVEVMNDISKLQSHIKENVTEDELNLFKECSQTLIDEAAPIVALLALGELNLETIFRQDPGFQGYVNEIIQDSEDKTNELVPEATSLIDEVIEAAFGRLPNMNLSGLDSEERRSVLQVATGILKGDEIPRYAAKTSRSESPSDTNKTAKESHKGHMKRKEQHSKKAPVPPTTPVKPETAQQQAAQVSSSVVTTRRRSATGRTPRGYTTAVTPTSTKSNFDKFD